MDDKRYKIISHRGNLSGSDPDLENKLEQIETVLKTTDFDIEIDVREVNDILFLGHDEIQESISTTFLLNNADRLWIHCKNLGAYMTLGGYRHFGAFSFNFFFHDQDPYALTSRGWLWGFPNKETFQKDIDNHYVHVLTKDLEEIMSPEHVLSTFKNFCTDNPVRYE